MITASVCDAMRKSGITDPKSLKAEHFCAFECPYHKCILARNNAEHD